VFGGQNPRLSYKINLKKTHLYASKSFDNYTFFDCLFTTFVKIGEFTKVNTTLLEKILDEAATTGKPLF
jgi:hypothetical protein